MERLTLSEISRAVGGRIVNGSESTAVTSVSTDTRTLLPGALYVPIIGETHDGHMFIESALEQGASAFLTQREAGLCAPQIVVEDTRLALGELAAYYRCRFSVPVVAVTGSSGKTSVKNGIAAVLAQKYRVHKTEGNYNNDIGLPLSVFNMDAGHTAAVFEMGMNNLGEISCLSKIVKPGISVITNVGTAHIGKLGSREGIMRAKLEISDGMSENGTLVLNYDNDLLRTVNTQKQKTVWVSASEKTDVYAKDIAKNSSGGADFVICYGDREIPAKVAENARPLVVNALLAAAVGFLLGLSDEEIQRGVAEGASESGRLERRKTETGGVIINDCYNANTDSMMLALDVLSNSEMKKIAVLGDMFEQGEYARAFHEQIGEYAYERGVDVLIAIGSDAKHYKSAFDKLDRGARESHYFESKQDFFEAGFDFGGKNAILLKASRGMKFEDILNYLFERNMK